MTFHLTPFSGTFQLFAHMQLINHQRILPSESIIELNFDGCSLGNSGQSGVGGVLRNHQGICLHCFSGPLGQSDAITTEIKALLIGLRKAHAMAPFHLHVEGDSVLVIGWMNRGGGGPWRLRHFLLENCSVAISMNTLFHWIPREANSLADSLAKSGVSRDRLSWDTYLVENFP